MNGALIDAPHLNVAVELLVVAAAHGGDGAAPPFVLFPDTRYVAALRSEGNQNSDPWSHEQTLQSGPPGRTQSFGHITDRVGH